MEYGVGLRAQHYQYLFDEKPNIDFLEVLSDNYLSQHGPAIYHLERLCNLYPIRLHGVGMSIASCQAIDFVYLKKLKSLIQRYSPLSVSDHLCWTSYANQHFHELLPIPFTEEALKHIVIRIKQIQDFLERQILIENVSSYIQFNISTFTEYQFLEILAEEANCLILLDINNIYVSAKNHQYSPIDYLSELNTKRVSQFHLAGFEDKGSFLLDNHGNKVHSEVWNLYSIARQKFRPLATVFEWDNNIPSFDILLDEIDYARNIEKKFSENSTSFKPRYDKHQVNTIYPAMIIKNEPAFALSTIQQHFAAALNTTTFTTLNFIDAAQLSHLQIYKNSIHANLQKALQAIYPVCYKLVGEEFFIALSDAYIKKNPSVTADLANYGNLFADFIKSFKAANTLPYLPDIAKLEWAWHQIYILPAKNSFDLSKLSELNHLSYDGIYFSLPQNSFLIDSSYPIHLIWEANQDDTVSNEVLDLAHHANHHYYLIWRNHQNLHLDILTKQEWQILKVISLNMNFKNICMHLTNEIEPHLLHKLFLKLFQKNWMQPISSEAT